MSVTRIRVKERDAISQSLKSGVTKDRHSAYPGWPRE